MVVWGLCVLLIRVPYYFGDLILDPNLENHPFNGTGVRECLSACSEM